MASHRGFLSPLHPREARKLGERLRIAIFSMTGSRVLEAMQWFHQSDC
ncbi:hypothetical protein NKDENANG_02100 [Candidatus Entotheonellaceae bacterium PAL068K]